jgi:hypothetical protein
VLALTTPGTVYQWEGAPYGSLGVQRESGRGEKLIVEVPGCFREVIVGMDKLEEYLLLDAGVWDSSVNHFDANAI